jgi:protein-S-isoprenylcysteine O-methyltransferase Ste14
LTRGFAVAVALSVAVLSSRWAMSPAHEVLEFGSYLLLIVCVLGRSWCSLYIGGRKAKLVVDGGPYSVVRNPLYVFSFIGVLGIGLASGTATLPVLMGAAFALYYSFVVREEERALTAKFGQEFAEYLNKVPRWIPDFSLWQDVRRAEIDPRTVLITMRDSVWFFAALPAFELIEWLQTAGHLPIFLRLP